CNTGVETDKKCQGGVCTTSTKPCGTYACSGGQCVTYCNLDAECATGRYCSGGSCFTKLVPGAACISDHQCVTGNCVDGVCCDKPLSFSTGCNACNVSGWGGTCHAVPPGMDPHGVCPAGLCKSGGCNGTGSCSLVADNTSCGSQSCANG